MVSIAGFNFTSKSRVQADMKNKLKKRLRELLPNLAAELDPAFEIDPAFAADPQLIAVRRLRTYGQWQFVALSFSTLGDRFFVEVAYSPHGTFPIDRMPLGPDLPAHNGMLRFRASGLWLTRNQSGGWLIWKSGGEPATDTILPP